MDSTHYVGDNCPGGHADDPMPQASGHDPLCACALREHFCENSWAGTHCTKCQCHKIARVRADAEVAALREEVAHAWAVAHAEAVAAKLVEVICEQDEEIHWWVRGCHDLKRERDAARAEVAALREQIHAEALAAVKARTLEIGTIIEREVLADLRAKVEGLRDEAIWARRGTVAENGLDTVPSAWHNGRTSLADAVLALIEEAQP